MKSNRSAFRVIAGLAVATLFTWLLSSYVVDLARKHQASAITAPIDFVAFYCGARVLAERRDPYLREPLRSCERDALAESEIRIIPNLVVPAPLPPYALAVLVPFALLPFRVASTIFFLASFLTIGGAAVLCIRLVRGPPVFVACALSAPLILGSLLIGQIVPIVVASLCASALALRADRVWLSTLCAGVAMLEPHIGAAALVGMFVLERRARVAVPAFVAFLVGLSLEAGGFGRNIEYVSVVLPAHAHSEVTNFYAQYSLTAALYALGVGTETALRLGELSYLGMLAAGIVLARRLCAAYADRAFVVLAPAAATLVGGVFMHDHQMVVALPFAFLIASHVRAKFPVYAAIALLAVPWQSGFEVFFGGFFPPHQHGDVAGALARVAQPGSLADRTWEVWVRSIGTRDGRTPLEVTLFKIPTWLALATLGIIASRARRREDGIARPAPLEIGRSDAVAFSPVR
jgi:hypothetical protein